MMARRGASARTPSRVRTGALIGVIAGVILALSFTAASNYSMQTIAGYFAAILGLIGAVLGLGVAVLIERRRS
jgi:hypothetical protein